MSQSSSIAIEASHLHKVYKTTIGFIRRREKMTVAVEDISFNVRAGELFGIAGPNGAGKTTTIKMLCTLLLPTSGQARVLGRDVVKDTAGVRPRIGFTFGGGRGLYGRLSGLDNLKYFAELYGLEPKVSRKRIPELIELVGLGGRELDRVETYSNGMQQRLHLARAMLPDPELLFLDEPTVGIDPVGSRELRRIIKDLVRLGKTVLLSTHYMYEAEELCDRIAVINHGNIVALDTPAALKQKVSGQSVIEVQVKDDYAAVMNRLRGLGDGVKINAKGGQPYPAVAVRTSQPGGVMEALAPFLQSQCIQGLEVRNPTLEDVYISIVQDGKGG
jgi:ABC-2 type transport system ATP-binding protein